MRLTLWERQYRARAPRRLGTFEVDSLTALLAAYESGQRVRLQATKEAHVFRVVTSASAPSPSPGLALFVVAE